MKVLYVSYDGMTDALGRSQVIPYLTGLSSKGHKIHVISCEKKHIAPEETQEVKAIFGKHGIAWSPLSFSTRPPWLSKVLDVVKIKKQAILLQKKEHFDIVHCRSYIAALAGLELKKKYGVKFVFDMRGFWANERIEGYIWNLSNPVYKYIYRYFKKKEKAFFEYADAVVSLTHNGKGVINDLFGQHVEKKTNVIPCCVDTSFFSAAKILPAEAAALRKKLNISESDIVISYLGSTGTWYMTDEMLLFFRRVQEKYKNAKFLFISGDQPDFIMNKALAQGISAESIVIARATRSQVPLFLSLSAISIFFIRPVFSKKASSPTKQAEIMSMGIPLICNTGVGDTDRLFSDEEAGLVLKEFTQEEYDKAIARLDDVLKLDAQKIREKAIRFFNLEDGIANYDAIYRSITQK